MYSTSVNIKSIISEVSEAITEKLTDIINPIINEKNEVDRLLLNMPTIKDIIKKNVELERENKDLKKKKITVVLTDAAAEMIANSGYSKEMGARPLKRYIQDNITNKLSNEILFGALKNGGTVEVDFKDELTLKFTKRDTTA